MPLWVASVAAMNLPTRQGLIREDVEVVLTNWRVMLSLVRLAALESGLDGVSAPPMNLPAPVRKSGAAPSTRSRLMPHPVTSVAVHSSQPVGWTPVWRRSKVQS